MSQINLKPYAQYLTDNSKSHNTIKSYLNHIERFLKFSNNPTILTRQHLLSYKSSLQDDNSAQTICAKLSAIKSYNEYLIDQGLMTETIVMSKDFPKIQKQIISPAKVSENEALKFLDKIYENECFRNYTIAILMHHVGTRITETLNIKLKDINFEDGICIMRSTTTKGNKERKVYLNDTVIKVLEEYITKHRSTYTRAKTSPYLFCSRQSDKLTYNAIEAVFDKYSKKVNPHQLRHAMATWAIKPKEQGGGGLSLQQLAGQLGHGSIQTTVMYTHPDGNTMRKMLNR